MTIKTILWDFDGVIVDSMSVRDDAFRNALECYPNEQVEELISYHRQNGGLSRYHKFGYFFENIRKEPLTDEALHGFTSAFSEFCLQRLMEKSCLIQETVNFIQQHHKSQAFHIVSGSDQEELRVICRGLGIRGFFGDVLGSPTPKNQLVKDLLARLNIPKETTALVGDSENDYEAAMVNGIQFFGYRNQSLSEKGVYLDNINKLSSNF